MDSGYYQNHFAASYQVGRIEKVCNVPGLKQRNATKLENL